MDGFLVVLWGVRILFLVLLYLVLARIVRSAVVGSRRSGRSSGKGAVGGVALPLPARPYVRRKDLPAIGPRTIEHVARAGLGFEIRVVPLESEHGGRDVIGE